MSLGPTDLRFKILGAAMVAIVAVLAMVTPALAHDGKDHSKGLLGALATSTDAAVNVELLDLALIDKDGKTVRFESEAVADRIVVIDFIYTTCTTICPILSAVMARVQNQLGARLGKEVWLISISIDPTRDTPQRLSDYARNFLASPGWIWLTGEKPVVDQVLIGLDSYTPDFVDHPSFMLIGDARSNRWTRLFGFPAPEDIIVRLDELVATRNSVNTTLKEDD